MPSTLQAAQSLVVDLPLWFILWTYVTVAAGVVTLAKGRAGWFLLGILAPMVVWPIVAFFKPRPRSVWARVAARLRLARATPAGA